jgi:hypothetical protein
MKHLFVIFLLLSLLAGCSPASLVPAAPTVITDEKDITTLADEILPGARPVEGFIAGSGLRGSDIKMVIMPNALTQGDEYRMTIFLIGLPAGLSDEKAEARAQDIIMKTLSKKGWGVAAEGTENLPAGASAWLFKKNRISTEDTGKARVIQYMIVRTQKTHKAVLTVQGLENVMNRKSLEAFLKNIR